MQNLSSKLLAIKEIAEQIFGNDLQETYVISVWEHEINFSSHYERNVAGRAMSMDGAKVEIDTAGFTTIRFRHFEVEIKIILS